MKSMRDNEYKEYKELELKFNGRDKVTPDDMETYYEYCRFLYLSEKVSNVRFRNLIFLTIPFSVFLVINGFQINGSKKFFPVIISLFLLFYQGYILGRIEEWNKNSKKFMNEVDKIMEKRL